MTSLVAAHQNQRFCFADMSPEHAVHSLQATSGAQQLLPLHHELANRAAADAAFANVAAVYV